MKIKARVILASMVFVIVGMVLMFNHRRGVAFNVYAAPPNACTNQTIGGHFVFTEQGFLSASNTGPQLIGMFAPAAGIGVLDSDGQGNLSGSDTLSIGGLIIPRTFTGTYSLNPDCTGTAHIQPNSGSAFDIAIATDRSGQEVHSLQTNPQGSVFTSLARR